MPLLLKVALNNPPPKKNCIIHISVRLCFLIFSRHMTKYIFTPSVCFPRRLISTPSLIQICITKLHSKLSRMLCWGNNLHIYIDHQNILRTIGFSDFRVFGLLGIRTIGPSNYWAFGLSGLLTIGPTLPIEGVSDWCILLFLCDARRTSCLF